MSCNKIDNYRQSAERALAKLGQSGLNPFAVSIIKITWSGDRPGIGIKTKSEVPLTVGGYAPPCQQVSAKEVILSNERLTDMDMRLTLVYPYPPVLNDPCGLVGGGVDPNSFFTNLTTSSQQLYFRLVGGVFPATVGKIFQMQYLQTDGVITYEVYLRATGQEIHL